MTAAAPKAARQSPRRAAPSRSSSAAGDSSVDESLASGSRCDRRAGRNRSDPKPDPQFFPRGQISQRLRRRCAGRKDHARGGDWRRRDGLGHRAMAQLARRLGHPARRGFRSNSIAAWPTSKRPMRDAVKRGLMSEEKAKEGRARIVASTQSGSNARRADRDRSRLGKARDQEDRSSPISAAKTPRPRFSRRTLPRLPITDLGADDRTSPDASSVCIFSIRSAG